MKPELGEMRKRFLHLFDPAFQISFAPVNSVGRTRLGKPHERVDWSKGDLKCGIEQVQKALSQISFAPVNSVGRTRLGKPLERVEKMVYLISRLRFFVSATNEIRCRSAEHTTL